MKLKYSLVILTIVFAWLGSATAQNATIISGRVIDAEGSPLSGVAVEVTNADLSTTTKKDGSYKIVVAGIEEAQMKYSLKDYEPFTKTVKLAGKQMTVDAQLKTTKIEIKMTDFKSQIYIRGKITGLAKEEFSKYKIVAYVLTDQWYIHPFAEDVAGKGYASIDREGNWELQTVWRGFQAYKVAFLLVGIDAYVPPVVRLRSGPPESSLLAEVKCDDRFLIIKAPTGI